MAEPSTSPQGGRIGWLVPVVATGLMALITWLVLAFVLWAAMYGSITRTYFGWLRALMQFECGQMVDDERLYVLKPGSCRFANAEYDITFPVDADGFRSVAGTPREGALKLVLLGDSHAVGWGVPDGRTLADYLAGQPRFRVRNLAMPSYGTARELIALSRHARDADLVVLQYCDNDLAENLEFLADPKAFASKVRERAAQFTAWRDDYKKGGVIVLVRKAILNRFFGALIVTWRLVGLPPRAPPPDLLQGHDLEREAKAFAGVLAELRDVLAGKQVIVLESNGWGDLRPGFALTFQKAVDAAGVKGVKVIDTSGVMTRRDYFYIDDHPNAAGHAKLALELMKVIGPARP